MNPALFAALAVLFFLFALWQANGMFAHRDRKVSRWWFITNGYSFYTGRNFLPEAAPFRRRFIISASGFFLCVVAAIALAMLRSQS